MGSAFAYGCGSDSSSGSGRPGSGGEGGEVSGSGEGGELASAPGGADGAGGAGEVVDCIKTGPIQKDTTWAPAASCPDGFEVPFTIQVTGSGTSLNVEAGTKLKFDAGAGLEIQAGAALVAIGTAAKPVLFTGWQELAGSWGGIVFYSNAVSNELSNAVVEYAGSEDGASGNVSLSSDGSGGRVKLNSTTLRYGAKFGLTVLDGAALAEFADNVISDNEGGAIRVGVTSVDQLAGTGNTLEANGNDNSVRIETSILHPLLVDATWPNLAPAIYRVTDAGGDAGAQIYVKSHLSIEAGAIFEFAGGSGIDVSDGTAGLSAVGTVASPIIFRGVDGSGWTGIGFCESGWSGNALENVEVHNASGPPDSWSYCGTGADVLRPSVLVGHNFTANASLLRIKGVTFAGPNNAAADIAVKAPSKLTQQGTNVGTGVANALVVEAF